MSERIGIEHEVDSCIWKVVIENENSSTFQDVKEGHKLYNCVKCPGIKNFCPDYRSYNELIRQSSIKYRKN